MMTEQQFLDECAFAKVIVDKNGNNAILIGGHVIEIDAPPHIKHEMVEHIVTALRRTIPRDTALASAAPALYSGHDTLKGN